MEYDADADNNNDDDVDNNNDDDVDNNNDDDDDDDTADEDDNDGAEITVMLMLLMRNIIATFFLMQSCSFVKKNVLKICTSFLISFIVLCNESVK